MNITAPPVPGEAARFALRRATRGEHALLDTHPAFAAMAAATLSPKQYGRLMQALAMVYRRLDPAVEAACDRFGLLDAYGFRYQARAPMLERDCAALGLSPGEEASPRPLTPIPSATALAGALYVIEGSVLGGAMLHQSTRRFAGPAGDPANGYWAWCATAGKARWAATCRLIEALDADGPARQAMGEAARAVFGVIAEGLEPLAMDMDPHRQPAC